MTPLMAFVPALVLVTAVALAPAAAGAQTRPPARPGPTPGALPATPTAPGPAASPATTLPPAPALGALAPLPSDYVIGPGDVLQVSVWKNDTLSRVVPVRPDGKISMPLLHDIQAEGLTAMQLRDKIGRSLAEFLPNPEVSVTLIEVRSLRVSVLGEVQKPGVLELRGRTTILEAIAMAGGFRDFASPSKITVIRTGDNGETKKIRFNYNRAISNASEEPNMVLHSGDVVIVP
jgi:polysaccharide export outer membrane protein